MPTPFLPPLVDGDHWAQVAAGKWLEQCWTSVNERKKAVWGDTANPMWPFPAPGGHVADYRLWSLISAAPLGSQIFGMESALYSDQLNRPGGGWGGKSTIENFIDHRGLALEGNTVPRPAIPADIPFWTIPNIRDAAGLPVTKVWFKDFATGLITTENTALRNRDPRCKRRRQIYNMTANQDVEGNSAVVGQRAFGNWYGTPAPPLPQAGWRYRYAGLGNWVRDETVQADMLDNTLDPPNYCYGGALTAGDAMGNWKINELIAILDLLRWTIILATRYGSNQVGIGNAGASQFYDTGFQSGYAGAIANLNANWNPQPPNGLPLAEGLIRDGGFGFEEATANRYDTDWAPLNDLSAIKKKWFYYIFASKAGNDTFNANGDPVLDGVWHQFANSAGAVATISPNPGTFGNVNTPPVIPPDPGNPPGVDTTVTTGYEAQDVLLLCKWNVPGGFTYCSVTD